MTVRGRRASTAQSLKEFGYSALEISKQMDLSRSYISSLLTDPDGTKDAARKKSYSGICKVCGGPTSGSNGRSRAPSQCAKCIQHPKFWTRDLILRKIHEWADIHDGGPPIATDWLRKVEGSPGQYVTGYRAWGERRWPSVGAVQREFGSWSNAIEAAGFSRPRIGCYIRTEETRRKLRESRTRIDRDRVLTLVQNGYRDEDIAVELRCSVRSIKMIRIKELGVKRDRRGSLLNKLFLELLKNDVRYRHDTPL